MELSQKANKALMSFQNENWEYYLAYHWIYCRLIPFLTDSFEIDVDPNLFPDHEDNETAEEEDIRRSISDRLMNEFESNYPEVYDADELGISRDEHDRVTFDHEVFLKAFYWHLNRQPRVSSNLTRSGPVETRDERYQRLRRQRYDEMTELSKRQKLALQEDIERRAKLREKRALREERNRGAENKCGTDSTVEGPSGAGDALGMSSAENPEMSDRAHWGHAIENVTNHSVISEPEGPQIRLENIGPVDRTHLLNHFISRAMEKYDERYGKFLMSAEGKDVRNVLEEGLNQAVKDMCENGKFTLDNLRLLGENPEGLDNAGVYMHILSKRSNADQFWPYIGQAAHLCQRIKDHNDSQYRKRHPCLHYYMWDSQKDIESVFVTLTICKGPTDETRQFILNLAEMWMACLFQTLTARDLEIYLPKEVNKLWVGHHLNVIPPLWQGFTGGINSRTEAIGGRKSFESFLRSPDPTIRQWAKDARDAFNDIRNSPDPALRQYYFDNLSRNLQNGMKTSEQKKFGNMWQYLLTGVERKIMGTDNGQETISCGQYAFTISRFLNLPIRIGGSVHVQFHLTETPNPMRYARNALPIDPSARLAVTIKGCGIDGKSFHVWLENSGEFVVMRMNVLVDILEGFTREESKAFERRWFVDNTGDERQHFYT